MKKYQCPCCGYFTYNVPANEDCGYICPVCFWEKDPFIIADNEPSDSNHGITLKEAKFNLSRKSPLLSREGESGGLGDFSAQDYEEEADSEFFLMYKKTKL